jgi:hypothetical protein
MKKTVCAKNLEIVILTIAMALLMGVTAYAQNGGGQGQAVVTVLPKHDGEAPPSVTNQDLAVKVNGKNAKVTKWQQYQSPGNNLELVLLIDDSARSSLGRQMDDIAQFIKSLPPNVTAAVAYMQNGRAIFAAPLSADHDQVLRALHLPGGSAGSSASPYFCLSDLAKNWPSKDPEARREVVMVTDGVDNYQREHDSAGFSPARTTGTATGAGNSQIRDNSQTQDDPEDPYVQAAITDSVRARLVVYSIYWLNRGRTESTLSANNAGQNLLAIVTQATGGKSFREGRGNPVSFESYFDELTRRFRNQYELGFTSSLGNKPKVETMKLKLSAPGTEVDTPQQVLVVPAVPAQK